MIDNRMFDADSDELSLEERYQNLEAAHEKLKEKYRELVDRLGDLFKVNQAQIIEDIVRETLKELKAVESPEPLEGIESGFDFWGLLITEGGDNGLYSWADELLRGSLIEKVKLLSIDQQLVLITTLQNKEDVRYLYDAEYFEYDEKINDIPKQVLDDEDRRYQIEIELRNFVCSQIPEHYRQE